MSDTSAVMITACTEADIPALKRIEDECFGGEAWSRESISRFVGGENVTSVAARCCGETVGCAFAISVCDEAEILKVAVLPEYRRRGAARGMISELERLLTGACVTRLLLEVRAGNTGARALYASAGFVEYGVRRSYYVSPREDAVLMEKRVSDVAQKETYKTEET